MGWLVTKTISVVAFCAEGPSYQACGWVLDK